MISWKKALKKLLYRIDSTTTNITIDWDLIKLRIYDNLFEVNIAVNKQVRRINML